MDKKPDVDNSVQANLHSRLKNATSAIHRDLEAGGAAARLMSDDLTRGEYLDYLVNIYGFVYPLEHSLKSFDELQKYLPDLDARWKASRLATDIQALGAVPPALVATTADLPELTSLAAAFGALYVMEGSTLGGQLMRKKLLERDFVHEKNIAHVSAYRENTGSMWREFLNGLARFEATVGSASAPAIPAAEATFRSLGQWLKARSPSRA